MNANAVVTKMIDILIEMLICSLALRYFYVTNEVQFINVKTR